jgi:hypothetical protein
MATWADGLETMWCRRREMGRILPNGAGADTIGAVIAKCPSGALHPWGLTLTHCEFSLMTTSGLS